MRFETVLYAFLVCAMGTLLLLMLPLAPFAETLLHWYLFCLAAVGTMYALAYAGTRLLDWLAFR